MAELSEQEKTNRKVINQNYRILANLSKKKMKRHVKEKNEPAFDSIMKEFSDDYSKTVVMNSSEEIINLIGKNE